MKYFRHEIFTIYDNYYYIIGVSILLSQRGLTPVMGCIMQRNHRSYIIRTTIL